MDGRDARSTILHRFAHKFFLPVAPAVFRSRDFRGGKMRAGVKPAGQRFAARERTGLAREVGEDGLRHILRQMRVAVDLPQRGGIDEIDVPADQFGEGVFGMGSGVIG